DLAPADELHGQREAAKAERRDLAHRRRGISVLPIQNKTQYESCFTSNAILIREVREQIPVGAQSLRLHRASVEL
ncbi:MAG: hypothetical protein CBD47_02815, partial [Synechococcus sp. TMED187]